MEFWAKFYPHIFRHPKVKAFRPGSRCKALEFVALSLEFGAPGVVDLYDDEIRACLGLSLEGWLSLRDLLILRGLIRQVARAEGSHVYEVAFWLLPEQAGDGRSREAWTEPSLPEARASERPSMPDTGDRSRRHTMTGCERKALFDERRRCLKAGLPLPNRDTFVACYRAQKAQQSPVPPQTSEPVESGPAHLAAQMAPAPAETVTKIGNESAPERNEAEKERAETATNTLSPRGNESQSGNESEKRYPVPESEKAVVVAFLSETGVTLPDGEIVLLSRRGAEMCAEESLRAGDAGRATRQAEWLPYRKPPTRGEWGGMLRTAILENWPCPEAYRARMREKKERERQEAERRKCAQAAQARHEAERARSAQIADYWQALMPEERAEIEGQARERLSAIQRQQLRKREEAGQEAGPLIGQVLEGHRRTLLLQQMVGG